MIAIPPQREGRGEISPRSRISVRGRRREAAAAALILEMISCTTSHMCVLCMHEGGLARGRQKSNNVNTHNKP